MGLGGGGSIKREPKSVGSKSYISHCLFCDTISILIMHVNSVALLGDAHHRFYILYAELRLVEELVLGHQADQDVTRQKVQQRERENLDKQWVWGGMGAGEDA